VYGCTHQIDHRPPACLKEDIVMINSAFRFESGAEPQLSLQDRPGSGAQFDAPVFTRLG
jgi:hypothetical protein